ncbi:DUF4232 domain-containing protein [Granulicoccus phenolivorans]|uniref:DUF4232 domain-containing protein n=1 Tax=Granulicoccus phenolivorans TaxID=266854 RepID=UPI0011AE3504|nr:DUF4232 domain-containing protein [Granulicoccus phenolivorans]
MIGALVLSLGLGACTTPFDVLRSRTDAGRAVPSQAAGEHPAGPASIAPVTPADRPTAPAAEPSTPAPRQDVELEPQAPAPSGPPGPTTQPPATGGRATGGGSAGGGAGGNAAGGSGTAAAGECGQAQLSLWVVADPAASGADFDAYLLWLQNLGSAACTMKGFPGVDFVAADGRQIGADGARDRTYQGNQITLSPGERAASEIRIKRTSAVSGCQAVPAYGIQVIPPNTRWLTAYALPGLQACANAADKQLSVRSVRFVG